MVPAWALAIEVDCRPNWRMICIRTPAKAEKQARSWLVRIVVAEVRSANRSSCCSLIRFSISARAQ